MSDAGEIIQAIGGLVIGGIIFMTFGSALADSTLNSSTFLDFQFWGTIYVLAAVVLGIVFVGAMIVSIFGEL